MPFKIGELSNFKNVRTLAPGAALILADGDEKTGFEVAPFMIIGVIGSTAASARRPRPFCPADRDHDSRRARRADHDVRTGPHRRPARLRDADRRHQRQGQYAGDRSCNGCGSAARARCASSAARRATSGPRRSRVSAPCATESSRARLTLSRFARAAEDFSAFAAPHKAALRSPGDLICWRRSSDREMHHVGPTGKFSQVSARAGTSRSDRFPAGALGPRRSSPTTHRRCW